jgi:hypothetical protein
MPDLFLELLHPDHRSGTTPPPLTESEALELLSTAEFTGAQLIPWGSNYSFAVALTGADGREQLAVYKPRAGEAPLYDFPEGTLFLREVAAYLLSRVLEWDIVPPTVVREGPHGVGSLQLYVEPMPESDAWDPRQFWGRCSLEIERVVLLDHIANNADRKLSHCLRDVRGKVWGIDHGLTFNEHPKLRTSLWQFVGRPVNRRLLGDLQRLIEMEDEVGQLLCDYLSTPEIESLMTRVRQFAESGNYPRLNPRRNIPYGWW